MKSWMFVGLALLALLQGAYGQNYKLLKSVPVGGEGGWDYLAIDANARKLYVTHASKIVIVDLAQDKVVGEIADTPGVHGFAVAPELGHGFSSNGAESRVSVVDLKTLKTIAKIETGENPDAILYEPTRSEVYAFNGRGKSATVIDAKNNQIVSTVPLTQLAFASCGDGTLTIAKEEALDKLTAVQTLTTERGARTMALDPATHRIYTCTAQIAPEPASPSPPAGERRRPNYVPGTFHLLIYEAAKTPR